MRNLFFDWQMYRSAVRACQGFSCPRSARTSGRRHRLDESVTEVRTCGEGARGEWRAGCCYSVSQNMLSALQKASGSRRSREIPWHCCPTPLSAPRWKARSTTSPTRCCATNCCPEPPELEFGIIRLQDGRKIDSPRFLRRAEKQLKKAQRSLSRMEKGSANRDKARLRVARAHATVADARREFHHQLSTKLIRENQAIAVEDLAVEGLARTRLAKAVHDAGWSQFVTMLEYKMASRCGPTFVRIGRFEPTSQVCSA
ncbi:transposase [Streptomyces sp. DSM 41524]|uniref:Transposase n=1 Tax=Streptomyces asiaticus subsp. ignotus TaxID=3098222 RepID=A0ABU7Q411_9ACTN|nr:transposase [Streptomyces sp. DSM 41524]